jgi:hypothetical protein
VGQKGKIAATLKLVGEPIGNALAWIELSHIFRAGKGATMLQLGWKAVELLEYAVLAEQAGFDSISASVHFHPWSEIGDSCFV